MSLSIVTNEDNKIFLAGFDDYFFDCAICDPEYGIGESGKNHKSRNTLVRQSDGKTMRRCPSNPNYKKREWDNMPPSYEFFKLLFLKSTNQIIFGANYFVEIVGTVFSPPRRNDFKKFITENPVGWIIWDKVNGTNDFNDCELIWTSFNRPSFIIEYMWAGMMQGVSINSGTIMQGNKQLNEKRIHETQKPVIIYKWLINQYVSIGQKIVDTHLGSGSLRIAAYDLDIDFYACELELDYYHAQDKRFKNYISQQKLIF